MAYLHEKLGIVLRLALLSLLLAAQSLSFAHEMGHTGGEDSNLCAVCSMFNGQDHPVHVEPSELKVLPSRHSIVDEPGLVLVDATNSPQSARGPPANS